MTRYGLKLCSLKLEENTVVKKENSSGKIVYYDRPLTEKAIVEIFCRSSVLVFSVYIAVNAIKIQGVR